LARAVMSLAAGVFLVVYAGILHGGEIVREPPNIWVVLFASPYTWLCVIPLCWLSGKVTSIGGLQSCWMVSCGVDVVECRRKVVQLPYSCALFVPSYVG
jgi:hypothetical protein